LSWQLSDFDKPVQYNIFRDAQKLTLSDDNAFEDNWLPLNQQITYQIDAVDKTTGVLIASKHIITKAGDSEPPSVPQALTVQSDGAYGAQLSWQPSTDNYGVKLYKIARNGQMYTHTSDTQFVDPWPPQGSVTYSIYAQDLVGNLSPISQTVEIEISHN
jgi:fibronectin type 3 domain-containing protein